MSSMWPEIAAFPQAGWCQLVDRQSGVREPMSIPAGPKLDARNVGPTNRPGGDGEQTLGSGQGSGVSGQGQEAGGRTRNHTLKLWVPGVKSFFSRVLLCAMTGPSKPLTQRNRSKASSHRDRWSRITSFSVRLPHHALCSGDGKWRGKHVLLVDCGLFLVSPCRVCILHLARPQQVNERKLCWGRRIGRRMPPLSVASIPLPSAAVFGHPRALNCDSESLSLSVALTLHTSWRSPF